MLQLIVCSAVGLTVWLVINSPREPVRRAALGPPPLAPDRSPRVASKTRLLAAVGVTACAIAWGYPDFGWWALPVAAALGSAGYFVLGQLEPAKRRAEREQMQHDLPATLDLLAAALRAGLPLRRALPEVISVLDGPLARRLRMVDVQIQLGEPEASAWRRLGEDPVIGGLAKDLARGVGSGVGLDQLLVEVAEQARLESRGLREQQARAVGVRTVLPLMVCFLPAFLIIGIVPIVAGFLTGFLN